MANEPPPWVIEAARKVGASSPCAKSKRGAVIFNPEEADRILDGRTALEQANISGWSLEGAQSGTLRTAAHNRPPAPMVCTGTEACRANCGKLCNHAEALAILYSNEYGGDQAECEMVHVKVVDGKVVAGGPPSCWQCSRLILETGLRGIWLYEENDECPSDNCPLCTGEMCNQCHSPSPEDPCEHAADERHKGVNRPDGLWRYYPAEQFHRLTLRNEGIRQ